MTNFQNSEKVFHQALSEIFEGLFFEEVVSESISPADSNRLIEFSWWVKLDILEPFQSHLIMVVRKDLMIQYTEAVFGMLGDEMPSDSQVLDNLGELMNTLCGRIMSLLLPAETGFRLGLPVLGDKQLPKLSGSYFSVDCRVGDNLVFLMVPEIFFSHGMLMRK